MSFFTVAQFSSVMMSLVIPVAIAVTPVSGPSGLRAPANQKATGSGEVDDTTMDDSAEPATPAADSKVDLSGIELRDCYGTTHALKDWQDRRLLVVAFLGTECPLAKLYGPRLQTLSQRFQQDDIQFVGVCSNVQDSLTDVQNYCQKAAITFPMLMDTQQHLADALGAQRTPEVFVLDHDRQIIYRGRIDDQYAIGVAKLKSQREDLALAIESGLQGRVPDVSETEVVGCLIGRQRTIQPHGDITYSRHIAPIFNQRCAECHRAGQIAPFPLNGFASTLGWEAMIAEVIQQDRMPPWNANPEIGHFSNDARLSAEEKRLVLTWIENGCPEGDPADLPAPPVFTDGWRMPQPDLIVHVREEPFPVPATGVVNYQYFEVDPGFTEDQYIVAAEARPGNPAVVHHIIAFLKVPGQDKVSLGRMLIGYAPGTSPLVFSEDTAMKVPAGSKILFEMHYTPNGTAQTDLSYIGLKFTSPDKVLHEVIGVDALNSKFSIPAGAADHQVTARYRFREDMEILSLTPHMHLRGKSFHYTAMYPDGTQEVLLDVPRYDFNWQLRYELQQPKLMPKGTVVECVGVFDNSEHNPNNPDPSKTIRWGQQSWDEMMIGFLTCQKPVVKEVPAVISATSGTPSDSGGQ